MDCFADEPEFVEAAVRGAYDRNLLSMQDINQAVLPQLCDKDSSWYV